MLPFLYSLRVRCAVFVLAAFVTFVWAKDAKHYAYPDLYEASIDELQRGLDSGAFSSVDLVKVRTTGSFPSFYPGPDSSFS